MQYDTRKFTAIKFYGLPLNHLNEKLTGYNSSSFVLEVMAIYRIVGKFGGSKGW